MKYEVLTTFFRSFYGIVELRFMNSIGFKISSVSKRLIIVLLLALGVAESKAQVYLSVSAGKKIFNIADTVCKFSSNYYYVYIKNTGSAPFFGGITLHSTDSTGTVMALSWTTAADSFLNIGLNPGDSIALGHTQSYDSTIVGNTAGHYYKMGGNIVVIWPSAQGAITVDSSEHETVTVLDCSGINEIKDDHGLTLYPNPCSDYISIRLKGNASISKIKIYDLQGELLKEYKSTETISFTEFSTGMYFLKVEFADKTVHTYKIIRRE